MRVSPFYVEVNGMPLTKPAHFAVAFDANAKSRLNKNYRGKIICFILSFLIFIARIA